MKFKHFKIIVIVFVFIFLMSCSNKKDEKDTELVDNKEEVSDMIYINNSPLIKNIPDPYVLKASDGKFYAYGTTDPETGYRVYRSTDMINWENCGLVYKTNRTWQSGDFWAPEVYEYNGKYYLFYTAREKSTQSLKLGVAVADYPDGTFIDILDTPAFDLGFAMIDAHVFFDEDGKNYLYYSKDCSENLVDGYHTSQIYGVELQEDLLTMAGEPILISTPDKDQETSTGQYRWNEAPFVIKKGNLYYLMYSSGYYAEASYHVSYSTSKSPLGPFMKPKNNELLVSDISRDFSGPGHNSVFYHEDEMYIAYHTHMYKNGGGNRQMNINKLNIDEMGNLKVMEPVVNGGSK